MTEFTKWRSIDKFSDAFKLMTKQQVKRVQANAKIKLHGTNAGIRLVDRVSVRAQKRSSDIWPDSDNAGFARWVHDNVNRRYTPLKNDGTVFFGEWAGKGVQKEDAVSQCPKGFYIFSVRLNTGKEICDPEMIQELVNVCFEKETADLFHIVPWFYSDHMEFDATNHKEAQAFIDGLVADVDKIGEQDPYILEVHGVDGSGEGLVGYVLEMDTFEGPVEEEFLYDYLFKVKTTSHMVQKQKNRANIGVEKPEGVDDFVETFVTEPRCEQMLAQIGGVPDRKRTGEFLKAIMSDIHKESQNEIVIADFEFKDAAKYVQNAAKTWWFKKCDEL